jgi:hypothetical protein
MHVYADILSVSVCIVCIGALGHRNHHSVPKTYSRDPLPQWSHSGHPRACAWPLLDPIPPPPPAPDFFIFSSRISVWTCLATALESARTLWRCHNFAQSASHDQCTGHNRVYSNPTFIYGLRMHQRCPTQEVLCLGPSCHSRRIVQNRPGRLKLGLTALPRALYRVHKLCWNRRVIITVLVHQRMPSCSIFNMQSYGSTQVKCTTNQTHLSVTDGY